MPDILITRDGSDLDSELAELARPIVAKWQAAILRVAAAQVEPAKFAIPPDKDSPEQILARRFRMLPESRRVRSGARAVELLAQKNRTQNLRRFINLDFSGASSVDQLSKTKSNGSLTKQRVTALVKARFADLGVTPSTSVTFPYKLLQLSLIRVRCVDETNGFLGSESGDDEIELGGSGIDESGDISKIESFKAGDFSDGDVKNFSPPRKLVAFNVNEGADYPKSYFAILILNESDMGNFSETMDEIIKKLKNEVTAKLLALLGAKFGASGGPIGALIGLLVGYAVGKIFDFLIVAWEDDPFKPQTIEVVIPSADATQTVLRNVGASQVVIFKGPGEYALRYAWTLSQERLTRA